MIVRISSATAFKSLMLKIQKKKNKSFITRLSISLLHKCTYICIFSRRDVWSTCKPLYEYLMYFIILSLREGRETDFFFSVFVYALESGCWSLALRLIQFAYICRVSFFSLSLSRTAPCGGLSRRENWIARWRASNYAFGACHFLKGESSERV